MMRAVAFSMVAGLALSPAQEAGLAAGAPSIQVAVEDAADLWSRPDGTGFANEVVRSAFEAAGVTVKFQLVPYARCKQMAIEGTIVACFSMSRDPALTGVVLFPSMPIFECYSELVQSPAKPLAALHLRGLPRGTAVGTVLGYEYPGAVREAVRDEIIVLDEERTAPWTRHSARTGPTRSRATTCASPCRTADRA